ncbi:unnamed protein product [Chironomus riparius]|uniref:Alpha 1,4-glycosyltransferase domain-containing protein n=1 Tax=Chironomus riparius TaxID=315576 RepID=A0A9N9S7Z8_9DIPT|nr:unnamed protein product [Chironomus riparius]
MEYLGIVKLKSNSFKLNKLKWQINLNLKFSNFQKIILIVSIILAIKYYNGPAENVYFKQRWLDGKTLKEASSNKLLKPWHQSLTSKNIFFHETSLIEDGIIRLNARQACAIESAALTNPNHNIFVMFASQVGFRNTSELPIIDALLSYPNINLNYLNVTKYAENTPLENWIKTDALFRSKYVAVHTADVLRLLSLFKYGGSHIDLDIVVMQSLDSQGAQNFAGAEEHDSVNNAFIHLTGESGHKIAEKLVGEIKNNFNGRDWAHNGPRALTRVLSKICGTKDVKKMTENDICENFKVLPIEKCYNITWFENRMFFEEKHLERTLDRLMDSLMVHIWNSQNAKIPLTKNDNVAYIHLARKYCPKTLKACDKF